MKKKALVSICIGAMLMIISAVMLTGCGSAEPKGTNNEETGVVSFSDVTEEMSFGIELQEGDNPVTVTVEKGKLHVEIIKYDTDREGDGSVVATPIYSGDFSKSETITVTTPEDRYYTLNISGKDATGTIQYK